MCFTYRVKEIMISIIIPSKGERGYLIEALDSIADQTFKGYEILIQKSNGSAGYNMNKGIQIAKGKYICYLCDDDLLTPDSLKVRWEFMEANNYDFIHSKGMKLHANGNTTNYDLTNPYAQFKSVLENNGIMGGSTMYRAEMLKDNLLNEDLPTAEEWELHLRLLSKGFKLGYLDKFSYIYRLHSGQKSIGNKSPEYQAKRNEVKKQIREWYTRQQ